MVEREREREKEREFDFTKGEKKELGSVWLEECDRPKTNCSLMTN